MKNITVSVDERVHRRARLRAAELNTSLSALVKGFLEDLAGDASAAERLDRQALHERGSQPRSA